MVVPLKKIASSPAALTAQKEILRRAQTILFAFLLLAVVEECV